MVISVPYSNAKVAQRIRCLYKNTFCGTRWFFDPAFAVRPGQIHFLFSLCSEGRSGRTPAQSVLINISGSTDSNPQHSASLDIFVETPYPLNYFSIWIGYGNDHMVISVPYSNAEVAQQIRRLHTSFSKVYTIGRAAHRKMRLKTLIWMEIGIVSSQNLASFYNQVLEKRAVMTI